MLSWFYSKKMHSKMSYLSKLKSHGGKIIINKYAKKSFIEHTIGFMCLTLIITTTGNRTRSLILSRRTEADFRYLSATDETSETETTEKIYTHNLIMLSTTASVWHWGRYAECYRNCNMQFPPPAFQWTTFYPDFDMHFCILSEIWDNFSLASMHYIIYIYIYI